MAARKIPPGGVFTGPISDTVRGAAPPDAGDDGNVVITNVRRTRVPPKLRQELPPEPRPHARNRSQMIPDAEVIEVEATESKVLPAPTQQDTALKSRAEKHLRRGNPGNRGGGRGKAVAVRQNGTTRTVSSMRQALRERYAERIDMLTQIADGVAMERTQISLAEILAVARCPKCKNKLKKKHKTGDPKYVMIEAFVTPKVKDRLSAMDQMGKHGLGTLREVSVDDVRERVKATIETVKQLLPPSDAARIIVALRPIWSDG